MPDEAIAEADANAPIRILHCMVQLDRAGAETLIMNIYRNIDRDKVQFDFLTSFDGEYESEIKALGGRVYHTPFISKVGPFKYAANLRSFFKQHPEYKIVHSHMDKFSGMPLREAEKCGVPVRIAHSHNIKSDGGLLYILVKGYYGLFVNANATNLMACSKEAAKWMFGKRASEAIILKNGIDLSAFPFAPKQHEGFVIANIGRFFPQKNHVFLLEIFKKLLEKEPVSRLLLIGDGALRPEIEKKAQEMGIAKSISFLGTRSDVSDILNAADAFCLPSLFEGFGISLVEAQAEGLPCVASSTVPAEANVAGGITYLPLGDAQQWADTMLSFKDKPKKDNRAAIKKAGYDIKETAAFLQNYYLNLAKSCETKR